MLESDTLTRFQQSVLMVLDVQDARMAEHSVHRYGQVQVRSTCSADQITIPHHPLSSAHLFNEKKIAVSLRNSAASMSCSVPYTLLLASVLPPSPSFHIRVCLV